MALSKDYEIPGTGVTVPNAYFIVDDIRVEKRMTDFPYPGMDLTDEQRVEKGEPLVNFKAGRVAWISIAVYANSTVRGDLDGRIIGRLGMNDSTNDSKRFRCFIEDGDVTAQVYAISRLLIILVTRRRIMHFIREYRVAEPSHCDTIFNALLNLKRMDMGILEKPIVQMLQKIMTPLVSNKVGIWNYPTLLNCIQRFQ